MTDSTHESAPREPDRDQSGDGNERHKEDRRRVKENLIRRVFVAQIVVLIAALGFIGLGLYDPERLGALALSFLCGATGGSLSLLKRVRVESLEVLKEIESSLVTTLMPFLYGGILALVTYLLFLGCFLTGDNEGGLFTSNLFPKFNGLVCRDADASNGDPLTWDTLIKTRPAQIKDYAKLLMWSLLSGYSEKFVDGILRTLERRES